MRILNLLVHVVFMFLFYINTFAYSETLTSGIEINKKDKNIKFTDCSKKKGIDDREGKAGMDYLGASFFFKSSKINDLRGDGIVYYSFRKPWVDNSRYYLHGGTNEYYRLDKNYKVISKGKFNCTKNKYVFELMEDNRKFLWKVSPTNQIVDIKSKIYDYKGYRRYQFASATTDDENNIYKSIYDYNNSNYTKVDANEDSSLKSGFKINKKDKVKYVVGNNTAYWEFIQLKMNDLRGDGVVYYLFNVDKFYRVNKEYKVVSKGSYKVIRNNNTDVYHLTSEDNQKFLFKISLSSQIVDIKSKFYDYSGYRRYEFTQAKTDEQEKIRSSIQKFEENKYIKVEKKQNETINVSLKSALDINKNEKKPLEDYIYSGTFFWNYSFLIDDLRGDGPVYYVFNIDEYHRFDKNFNVLSRGTFSENKKIFELKEDNLKFQWKISIVDKIVDIKSKFYDYKGFKRFHIIETSKKQKSR